MGCQSRGTAPPFSCLASQVPARPICTSLGEAACPLTWLPGRGISSPLPQLMLSGPDNWGARLGKLSPSSTMGLHSAYQALGCQIRNLCPLFYDCSPPMAGPPGLAKPCVTSMGKMCPLFNDFPS